MFIQVSHECDFVRQLELESLSVLLLFLTSAVTVVSAYLESAPVSSSVAMTAMYYKDRKVSPVNESQTHWLHGATTDPSAEVSFTCQYLQKLLGLFVNRAKVEL